MGCLVKSSLSALSSVDANVCPIDMTLDQYKQTYNGGFNLNFISALSGIEDFKNINFTNFYLTDEFLLDDVVSTKEIKVKPESFFTTLNFTTSSQNYLSFNTPSLSSFKDSDDIFNAEYYGKTSFTERSSQASDFEIIFIDDFNASDGDYDYKFIENLKNILNVEEIEIFTNNNPSWEFGCNFAIFR